jgi:hypothetical protein
VLGHRKSTTSASTAWLRHWVLPWQFIHLVGSAGWNVAGVVLVSQGQSALGPTASVAVAVVLLLLGVGLWSGFRRWRALYVTISVILGVAAFFAIVQAFTGEASLWPSAFWRWAGAGLNLAGLVANSAGIVIMLLWRDTPRADKKG